MSRRKWTKQAEGLYEEKEESPEGDSAMKIE